MNRSEIEYKLHQIDLHIADISKLSSEIRDLLKYKDEKSEEGRRIHETTCPKVVLENFKSDGFGMFTPPDITFNEMKNLGGK